MIHRRGASGIRRGDMLGGPLRSVVAVGAETVGKAPTGRDWPLVRGDALATGVSHSPLPADPQLLWKFPVAKGAFGSTPIIVDGAVYIGDLDGALRALDLATGKEALEVHGH